MNWIMMLWQISNLLVQIHVTRCSYSLQNAWQMWGMMEKLLLNFSLILHHICYIFPKMFLKCVTPFWFFFFLWVQILLYIGNAVVFRQCYEFFVILLMWIYTLDFCHNDNHSVQSFYYLVCFLLEKSKNSPSGDEMQRAFTRSSNCQMTCCKLAACFSNPASFASASFGHLAQWI